MNAANAPHRVCGTEVEISATVGGRELDPRALIASLHELGLVVVQGGFNNFGSRTHIAPADKGGVFEISSAECYPYAMGRMLLAGEGLVTAGVETEAHGQSWLIPRRVSDGAKTAGYHENFQILCDDPGRLLPTLNVFAATLSVWCGQGIVLSSGDDRAMFAIDQKSLGARQSSRDHSLVSIKDGVRYEFRQNNYPTFPWQLIYRGPYISAVIRSLELGKLPFVDSIMFRENPHAAALQGYEQKDVAARLKDAVALDPYLEMNVDGEQMSAIEFQRNIAGAVLEIARREHFPFYEVEACRQVLRVTSQLAQRDVRGLETKIPYLFKLGALQRSMPGIEIGLPMAASEQRLWKAVGMCVALDSSGHGAYFDRIRDRLWQTDPILCPDPFDIESQPCLAVAKERAQEINDAARAHRIGYVLRARWMSSELEMYPLPSVA